MKRQQYTKNWVLRVSLVLPIAERTAKKGQRLATKDYYQVLGVDKGIDQASIKHAYRRLVMQYHPDQNPGNSEAVAKMKEINEAHAVRRRRYDLEGYVVHQGTVTEDVFPGINLTSFFRDFGLEDVFGDGLFNMLFCRGRTARKKLRREV